MNVEIEKNTGRKRRGGRWVKVEGWEWGEEEGKRGEEEEVEEGGRG